MATATAMFLAGCSSAGVGGNRMGEPAPAEASAETSLSAEARSALTQLTAQNPTASSLLEAAEGVLVFPKVTKGGFMVGGFFGPGVLFKNRNIAGYYNTTGASYGWQAGIQQYGYALFFMSESALQSVDAMDGWEIGMGPSVVVVDEGVAKSLTTTTARDDVYAFIFDQKGLMAGMGLQGSKITRAK
jgi:lipid-binding SYLF domain-containing protein